MRESRVQSRFEGLSGPDAEEIFSQGSLCGTVIAI